MHVSITRVLVLVIALTGIVTALLAVPLWIVRKWMKRHPEANSARQVITPAGYLLYGCQTLLLFGGLGARQLQRNGPLGEFLQQPGGLVAYVAFLVVGSGIAASILSKLGYPPLRERGGDVTSNNRWRGP